MKRLYSFHGAERGDLPRQGLGWVMQTGGTIITNVKGTYENAFDCRTSGDFSKFERHCNGRGVLCETLRGGYTIAGPRLLMLYLDTDEIAKVEGRLESLGSIPEMEEIWLLVWNEKWAVDWVSRYGADLVGGAPEGWQEETTRHEKASLPDDIALILKYLADAARGYRNSLSWQEEAKLKADLMNSARSWEGVSVSAVKTECYELGMSLRDTEVITGWIEKRLAGRKLVPDRSYRDFKFPHDG